MNRKLFAEKTVLYTAGFIQTYYLSFNSSCGDARCSSSWPNIYSEDAAQGQLLRCRIYETRSIWRAITERPTNMAIEAVLCTANRGTKVTNNSMSRQTKLLSALYRVRVNCHATLYRLDTTLYLLICFSLWHTPKNTTWGQRSSLRIRYSYHRSVYYVVRYTGIE